MTSLCSYVFIFKLFFLSSAFNSKPAFHVIQNFYTNQNQTASFICEHDMNLNNGNDLLDVRLYRISQHNEKEKLCQKGSKDCKNIDMHEENFSKFVFILNKVGPEVFMYTYQCEITVEVKGVHQSINGTPAKLSHDFSSTLIQEVIPDQSTSINCDYSEGATLQDACLYRISNINSVEILCRKGESSCSNVLMYQEKTTFVFLFKKVDHEAINFFYQCEIKGKEGTKDYTEVGKIIKLQHIITGNDMDSTSSLHHHHQSKELTWISLLALMFLYSLVITCLYIRLTVTVRKKTKSCENSTYVVMKHPAQKSEDESIYHMDMFVA